MKYANQVQQWYFTNQNCDFKLDNPELNYHLYFPLANEAGMVSAITPLLYGDIKTGQNTFLTLPVSVEDLHNTRSNRNFWLHIKGYGAWSATGNSAAQIAKNLTADAESVTLEAGFLWHRIVRENPEIGIRVSLTNFVPAGGDTVELMKVTIINTGDRDLFFTPTAAIPVFGRSAANIRDHRHVTSLLHRTTTTSYGVRVCPTFCFDERGHQLNHTAYGILGTDGGGREPIGFFPTVDDFIGAGGSLEWPAAVVLNSEHWVKSGAAIDGYEALGGLRFQETCLEPGQSASYIIVMAIADSASGADFDQLIEKYGSETKWGYFWHENIQYWKERLDRLTFHSGSAEFDQWLKWVTLQPILRKIYGCSFLPYHDYGRGGRGWRDLWQDCLALLFLNPAEVRTLLFNNYSGVRIDGSNATIIGNRPGEFIADRNNISRVWMDHGAWPFFTTKLYIERSGDLQILLEPQVYFQDGRIYRSKRYDRSWEPGCGTKLRDRDGNIYRGTILEHILVQLVTQFFNVGANNHLRMEDADWNDALDMAAEKGESVAFTAFYAFNLIELAKMLRILAQATATDQVELAAELTILLDTLNFKIDYDQAGAKQALLDTYFDACKSRISGQKVKVRIGDLASDLIVKAEWLTSHIRNTEWISDGSGHSWYNSYYNNDGARVEGRFESGVRLMLTGQVFTIMAGIATPEQVESIIEAVDYYLKDAGSGGIRLNTDFGGVQTNLGRAFAFAYGHKENGAVFSHMAVMYAYALYYRGFVNEGYRVLQALYELSADFKSSRIYPGIPEYFDIKNRGAYPYLTGSASWLLFVYLTESYGVKGDLGDLALEPKLVPEQFDTAGRASITTLFLERDLTITYTNRNQLDYGCYRIGEIRLNGCPVTYRPELKRAVIAKELIAKLNPGPHCIEVDLTMTTQPVFSAMSRQNASENWVLKWSDEFDGDSLNMKNWSYQIEPAGRFNNEWQEYTDSVENCYIQNGNLVIVAKYNAKGLKSGNFTSARIITANKFQWKYGKISARLKLPYGKGIWPAFWMLGVSCNENGGNIPWPQCGEVDIMELIGGGDNDSTVYGTIHYFNEAEMRYNKTESIPYTLSKGKFADDYHLFELEWNKAEMIWRVDGIEYKRDNILPNTMNAFQQPFFIVLNLAVGGNWPGYPDQTTIFPQKMYVDWVRVYQRE